MNTVALNDKSDHGGTVITSNQDGTVKGEGKVIAVEGALHSCPMPGHGITPITAITRKTKINGRLVLTTGAKSGCNAIINGSISSVQVE